MEKQIKGSPLLKQMAGGEEVRWINPGKLPYEEVRKT